MTDREQTRRDAEYELPELARQCTEDPGVQRALERAARTILALLTELEQAEKTILKLNRLVAQALLHR